MPRLIVIDNYDSFTYNLVQMFVQYDLDVSVFRADKVAVDEVAAMRPDYLLVSPGPKDPQNAGISIPLIRALHRDVPILGVCLGMQSLNEAFGGTTVRAPVPLHGKTSRVRHDGTGVFTGLPDPIIAARYHSLMVRPEGTPLIPNALADDGVVMGLTHPEYPVHGVQFHPESFLTEHGFAMVENFLGMGMLGDSLQRTGQDRERRGLTSRQWEELAEAAA